MGSSANQSSFGSSQQRPTRTLVLYDDELSCKRLRRCLQREPFSEPVLLEAMCMNSVAERLGEDLVNCAKHLRWRTCGEKGKTSTLDYWQTKARLPVRRAGAEEQTSGLDQLGNTALGSYGADRPANGQIPCQLPKRQPPRLSASLLKWMRGFLGEDDPDTEHFVFASTIRKFDPVRQTIEPEL